MPDQLPLDNVVTFPRDEDPIVADVADLIHRYGYGPVLAEVRMHEPVHAVPSAPARGTDPETSHAAAIADTNIARFSANSRSGKLLAAFHERQMTDHEATVQVIGIHQTPARWDGCRRRCSDLRAAGYLTDSGYRRKNPGSSDDSIVWKLTYVGQCAFGNMQATGWTR